MSITSISINLILPGLRCVQLRLFCRLRQSSDPADATPSTTLSPHISLLQAQNITSALNTCSGEHTHLISNFTLIINPSKGEPPVYSAVIEGSYGTFNNVFIFVAATKSEANSSLLPKRRVTLTTPSGLMPRMHHAYHVANDVPLQQPIIGGENRDYAEHEKTALVSNPDGLESLVNDVLRLLSDEVARRNRILGFTWKKSTRRLSESPNRYT